MVLLSLLPKNLVLKEIPFSKDLLLVHLLVVHLLEALALVFLWINLVVGEPFKLTQYLLFLVQSSGNYMVSIGVAVYFTLAIYWGISNLILYYNRIHFLA